MIVSYWAWEKLTSDEEFSREFSATEELFHLPSGLSNKFSSYTISQSSIEYSLIALYLKTSAT